MQTIEIVKKVLHHQDIKLTPKHNEFKMKGSGNKPSFNLDPEGLRSFISQNYDYIKKRHNGSSNDIMTLLAKEESEIREALDELKSETVTVDPEKSSTLEYFKNLTKLVFTKAKNDKERYFIFNTLTNKEEEFHDIKTIETEFIRAYKFNPDQGKQAFQNWAETSEKYCVHTFHQNKPKLIPVDPDLKKWEYNNYDIPEYRLLKKEKVKVDEKKVELISEYFKHLIPDSNQREYVFAWVYTSLVSRQETFLCLMGAQGVGKTLFMDLWSQLLGVSNTVRPKDPNAQFNSYLTKKSGVIYDEVRVDGNGKEIFKRIANRVIQVERKGEDQIDVVNTASIMLASNYYYNLEVEPRDRRFSVPDLGSTPLEKALGKRKTTKLFKLLEDDHFLFWFYHWLIRKFEGDKRCDTDGEFSPTTPLKDTSTFEICCNVNAPDEVKFTLKLMRERDGDGTIKYPTITMEELIKKYKAEQKREMSSYKRINKHSMFYSPEMFGDTMKLYTIDGEPIIELIDNYTIKNNLIRGEETVVTETADPMG